MDIEKLRRDLIDYLGTAAFGPCPAAIVDLGRIQKASESELISIAKSLGLNLKNYEEWER